MGSNPWARMPASKFVPLYRCAISGAADPVSQAGSTPATPGSMHDAFIQLHREARSVKEPSCDPRDTAPSLKSPAAITLIGCTLSLASKTSQSNGHKRCIRSTIG